MLLLATAASGVCMAVIVHDQLKNCKRYGPFATLTYTCTWYLKIAPKYPKATGTFPVGGGTRIGIQAVKESFNVNRHRHYVRHKRRRGPTPRQERPTPSYLIEPHQEPLLPRSEPFEWPTN